MICPRLDGPLRRSKPAIPFLPIKSNFFPTQQLQASTQIWNGMLLLQISTAHCKMSFAWEENGGWGEQNKTWLLEFNRVLNLKEEGSVPQILGFPRGGSRQ